MCYIATYFLVRIVLHVLGLENVCETFIEYLSTTMLQNILKDTTNYKRLIDWCSHTFLPYLIDSSFASKGTRDRLTNNMFCNNMFDAFNLFRTNTNMSYVVLYKEWLTKHVLIKAEHLLSMELFCLNIFFDESLKCSSSC